MSAPAVVPTVACARAAHEANRVLCVALGDLTQLPWEDAPEWQRQSAIRGVTLALTEGTTPGAQHAAWAADKVRDGWVYGPEKNPGKKTHPCLVPYEQLPPGQRAKDALYQAVVRAMFEALTRAVVES